MHEPLMPAMNRCQQKWVTNTKEDYGQPDYRPWPSDRDLEYRLAYRPFAKASSFWDFVQKIGGLMENLQ
jgi:hypothetical protein